MVGVEGSYNDKVIRQFSVMTVVWGVVGMLVGVFIAAQLVGPKGQVIGIDMTPEQLEVARRNVDPIMKNLGFAAPNVDFREGQIEEVPVESGTVDVVISNCVINLSSQKQRVFEEIHRILKPGG